MTTKFSRKLFVNLPVRDLERSIDFFTKLGFTFNAQFTDDTATCMIVGEDAYFMLLVHDRFKGFAKKPMGAATQQTAAIYAIAVESRAQVDELAKIAVSAGATPAADPMDHGFMYLRSFFDLDGNHWELLWMDPAAIQK